MPHGERGAACEAVRGLRMKGTQRRMLAPSYRHAASPQVLPVAAESRSGVRRQARQTTATRPPDQYAFTAAEICVPYAKSPCTAAVKNVQVPFDDAAMPASYAVTTHG